MNNQNPQSSKRKFNIADIIIIVVAVAVIVFVAQLFFKDTIKSFSDKSTAITYTVELQNVTKDFHGAVKTGDTVYNDQTGLEIGKIIKEPAYSDAYITYYHTYKEDTQKEESVIYSPLRKPGELPQLPQIDGYKNVKNYDKENITLEIRVDAVLKDGQYSLDGFKFTAGNSFTLRVPGLIYDCVITDVKPQTSNNKQDAK